MKANYHTHTYRCHHALGSDEQYVKSAIAAGFEEIGFSDHAPWKYDSSFVAGMRMKLDEFSEYKRSVFALKEKYRDQITIRLGLEAEYFPQYMPWLKEFAQREELDYILFGNHYYQSDERRIYFGTVCASPTYLDIYVQECINGLETGMYSYLCHPELFMLAYPEFDEHCERASYQICEAAKRLNIPLEYNLAGLRHNRQFHVEQYPHRRFWEIAKAVGNTAIIGVDAHHYLHLEDDQYWNEAVHYLDEELKIARADRLEMKGFSK